MYILIAIAAAIVAFFAWCIATAPRGYQDKEGFHKGKGHDDEN